MVVDTALREAGATTARCARPWWIPCSAAAACPSVSCYIGNKVATGPTASVAAAVSHASQTVSESSAPRRDRHPAVHQQDRPERHSPLMEVTAECLKSHYEQMADEELVELELRGTLTEIAAKLIDEEITRRGSAYV